jgi:hypothetical protein
LEEPEGEKKLEPPLPKLNEEERELEYQRMIDKLNNTLKVLTNEKRGGLKVIAFDKSPFNVFRLKFSNESIQSSSCERPKTA